MQHKFNERTAVEADEIKKCGRTNSHYRTTIWQICWKHIPTSPHYMKSKALFQKSTRLNPILIQINSAKNKYTYTTLSSHSNLGLPRGFLASGSQQDFFGSLISPCVLHSRISCSPIRHIAPIMMPLIICISPSRLLFKPKVFISTIFLFRTTDKISHAYKTIDKIILSFVLFLVVITKEVKFGITICHTHTYKFCRNIFSFTNYTCGDVVEFLGYVQHI
jgi:hypothetical protein